MSIILIQLPTVFCLIVMGHQSARILNLKALKYINLGWMLNFVYLVISLILTSQNKQILTVLGNLFDAVSCYYFYLAVLKSEKTDFFQKSVFSKQKFVIPAFVVVTLSALWGIFKSDTVFCVPKIMLDSAVLTLLAYFFYRCYRTYRASRLIATSFLIYAGIQYFAVLPESYTLTFNAWTLGPMEVGFLIGLFCKILILIGLLLFVNDSFKEVLSKENEMIFGKAFSEQLRTIIGRTYHEVTPPLLEAETICAELQDEEARYNKIFINKQGRLEISKIENAIQRMKTILTASQKMYQSVNVNLDPLRDNNEVMMPIDEDIDIHNINTLTEVAIMNIKAVVLHNAEKNYYVTGRLKFQVEFAANCSIECNSVEIVQIIYNLFKNSYEATEGRSDACNIFIKTKNNSRLTDDGKKVREVVLEVEDDGPGIPSDIQQQVFLQGFSTKGDVSGRGRGFGLDVVKAYTEAIGGTVEIESPVVSPRAGTKNPAYPGTKFILIFPKTKI